MLLKNLRITAYNWGLAGKSFDIVDMLLATPLEELPAVSPYVVWRGTQVTHGLFKRNNGVGQILQHMIKKDIDADRFEVGYLSDLAKLSSYIVGFLLDNCVCYGGYQGTGSSSTMGIYFRSASLVRELPNVDSEYMGQLLEKVDKSPVGGLFDKLPASLNFNFYRFTMSKPKASKTDGILPPVPSITRVSASGTDFFFATELSDYILPDGKSVNVQGRFNLAPLSVVKAYQEGLVQNLNESFSQISYLKIGGGFSEIPTSFSNSVFSTIIQYGGKEAELLGLTAREVAKVATKETGKLTVPNLQLSAYDSIKREISLIGVLGVTPIDINTFKFNYDGDYVYAYDIIELLLTKVSMSSSKPGVLVLKNVLDLIEFDASVYNEAELALMTKQDWVDVAIKWLKEFKEEQSTGGIIKLYNKLVTLLGYEKVHSLCEDLNRRSGKFVSVMDAFEKAKNESTEYAVSFLHKLLGEGEVRIEFIDLDGSYKEVLGTSNNDILEKVYGPILATKSASYAKRVFIYQNYLESLDLKDRLLDAEFKALLTKVISVLDLKAEVKKLSFEAAIALVRNTLVNEIDHCNEKSKENEAKTRAASRPGMIHVMRTTVPKFNIRHANESLYASIKIDRIINLFQKN